MFLGWIFGPVTIPPHTGDCGPVLARSRGPREIYLFDVHNLLGLDPSAALEAAFFARGGDPSLYDVS